MYEVPEPENYSEKEVYAFFGLAAYSAQVLEKGLVNMVVTFKTFGLPITRSEFDAIFAAHDSKTIGQLLRLAHEHRIPIAQQSSQLLQDALHERNHLNHNFFADYAGDFMIEVGRRTMIQRLSQLTRLFHDAERVCEPIYRPLLKQMGVTEELLATHVQKLIADAASSQIA